MRAKTAPSTLRGRADSTPHMQIVERLSVREVTGSRHVHRDASASIDSLSRIDPPG